MKKTNLPDGWQYYDLGELLPYEQPTQYIVVSTDYRDEYETPVLTAGKTFVIGHTNETDGIYTSFPAIIFDDFTTASQYVNFKFKVKSSAMKILKADKNVALTKYLYYMMQIIECEHSTHKRYWIQTYSKYQIPLPILSEQERIVAKLDELFSELDKGVEALKKAREQLKIYRQAVLKDAFEGKLTFEWRNTSTIPSPSISQVDSAYIRDLPHIPSEWKYVLLNYLGDLGRGKSKHRPRNDKALFEDGKYPFVQTGDIKAANRYLTEFTTQYNDFGLHQSKIWPVGTLCITIAANIAETAFLGIDACFPDSIVGFKNYEDVANAEYIEYFIQSAKIKLWAFAPATAQKNINLATLENIIVPLCSIQEQEQVVCEIETRLSICDNLEILLEETLTKSEGLRQSILKKAFEGKLLQTGDQLNV